MPRTVIVVNNFGGGLANHGSARDIQDKELYVANNILVSTEGLITMPGGPEQETSPTGSTSEWSSLLSDLTSGTVKTGHGLFSYSADRSSTGGESATDYYVIGSKTGGNVKAAVVMEKDGTKWASTGGSTIISLTTGASTKEYIPNFYYVNNGLRICDGNLDDTTTSRQGLFYIKHKVFKIYGSTSHFGNYDNWYSTSCNLLAPTQGLWANRVSSLLTSLCTTPAGTSDLNTTTDRFEGFSSILSGYYVYNTTDQFAIDIVSATDNQIITTDSTSISWPNGARYTLVTAPGLGFAVELERLPNGSWTTGEYDVAGTFIYDGSQESPLYPFQNTKAFTITSIGRIEAHVIFHGPYPRRITGARAYIKKRNTNEFWSLLADIDFRKEDISGRTALDVNFSARNTAINAALNIFESGNNVDTPLVLAAPNVDSYESISGVPSETTTMNVKYKTVAINNNVTYIGNVKIGDKLYEDSIFKSHVNAHDMFYDQRRLDIASGDGERIIALHSFADRLLEFKERTMYIVNISQDVEFIEDVHFYKGITYPHQAINTEYGVAWLNDYGVYLYNGERVIDLFLDPEIQGRRKIDLGYYRTFLGTTPTIAYDGREKRLLVINNTTGVSTTDSSILIYDLLDNSWVRWNSTSGNHGWANGTYVFTNFITDFDRYPRALDQSAFVMSQWISTNASTTQSLLIETKDYDFGEPGLKKNVYRIYLTYKGSQMTPYYKTNGDTALYNLYTTTSSTQINLPAASSYTTLRLTPSNATDAKNIYSIQLLFKATTSQTPGNYGINDINIIGRIKGKR
jgi:hypothetical protein